MRALLDLILPPLCPLCCTIVPHKNTVCPPCWKELSFISAPFCPQCALPFETSAPEEGLSFQKCGACLQAPPSFSSARAAYVYDSVSRKMILSFKHGEALSLAPFLGQALWHSGKDLVTAADLIVPVPLHWLRLYKRGFNQAAILAQWVGKLSSKPVSLNALKKIHNTVSQGNLSWEGRSKNVAHCFKVSNSKKIKDKSILLIDDVMTTGATLNACSKILLKEGAKKVTILCVARVKTAH